MILTCPNCSTRYQTDAILIAAPGRNVRCAKCGQTWFQTPIAPEAEPEPPAHEHESVEAQSQSAPMAASLAPAAARDDTDDDYDERHPATRGGQYRGMDERPSAPRRPNPLRVLAWVALIVVVIAVILAILHSRQTVAALWPKTATVFAAIGMNVNTLGLDFEGVNPGQGFEAGQPVLAVSGRIVNITDHTIPVPPVRVGLVDDQDREVYHWVFDAGLGTLAPGAGGTFTTRLSAPPQEAKTMVVRFADGGETDSATR